MKFGIPVYEYVMTPNWWKMVKMEDKFYWEVSVDNQRAPILSMISTIKKAWSF